MEDVIENQDGALENTEKASEANQVNWEAKAKELEAEAAKYKRIAERAAKKAERSDEPSSAPLTKDPSELDFGQKAFLKASGIQGSDELALVKEFIKRTGDSLDSVVEDDIFQARLERLRTTKSNELAAQSAGRGTQSADVVARELAKLGPNDSIPENLPRDVREKLVDLRRGKAGNQKQFYND